VVEHLPGTGSKHRADECAPERKANGSPMTDRPNRNHPCGTTKRFSGPFRPGALCCKTQTLAFPLAIKTMSAIWPLPAVRSRARTPVTSVTWIPGFRPSRWVPLSFSYCGSTPHMSLHWLRCLLHWAD
jgi:hypothetical protein